MSIPLPGTPGLREPAREEILHLAGRYERREAALLPALFMAQRETGYLAPEALAAVASALGLPLAEVTAAASFYSQLHLKPMGRHQVQVCTGLPCALNGCSAVLRRLEEHLDIAPGETTADGIFTLRAAPCLAACDEAPVIVVDEDRWARATPDGAPELLDRYRTGALPSPPPAGGRVTTTHSILLRWTQGGGMPDLEDYRRAGGYEAARTAAAELTADQVTERVAASGLRGKGGAGFPAGQKWKFIPRQAPVKYLLANADEGEPGTFKDRTLIEGCPHLLIEGILIAATAIGARKAYIYVRRELHKGRRLLEAAVTQARGAGYVGEHIFGSRHTVDVVVHSGAGAYIAGEESALLDSLEGRRALPRTRPPFPAQAGLYRQPTLVHNVETLCHLPAIITLGPERYRALGPPALFSVSGAVRRPGVYELPLGITLRSLISDHAGGLRPGRRFKAAFPGGTSSLLLTAADLDVPMDYDTLRRAGTMLGSAAVIVLDDTADMVEVATRATAFYCEESCGKCTPCRIGTRKMLDMLTRIVRGEGSPRDLERLEQLAQVVRTTSFCGLGQTAPSAVISTLRHFRDEYAARIGSGH